MRRGYAAGHVKFGVELQFLTVEIRQCLALGRIRRELISVIYSLTPGAFKR